MTDSSPGEPGAVVVYWRPGCGFCRRLMKALGRAGVSMDLRNIWEDDEARRFVADHNGGNETVPTVQVGERVAINPNPGELTRWLAEAHPNLVGQSETSDEGSWRDRLRLF